METSIQTKEDVKDIDSMLADIMEFHGGSLIDIGYDFENKTWAIGLPSEGSCLTGKSFLRLVERVRELVLKDVDNHVNHVSDVEDGYDVVFSFNHRGKWYKEVGVRNVTDI